MNSTISLWRLVTSGVPHKFVFNIFISYISAGPESTLSKFADWLDGMSTKLVDMLERKDAIHRDLYKLERWAHVNLVRFNTVKSKVSLLRQPGEENAARRPHCILLVLKIINRREIKFLLM